MLGVFCVIAAVLCCAGKGYSTVGGVTWLAVAVERAVRVTASIMPASTPKPWPQAGYVYFMFFLLVSPSVISEAAWISRLAVWLGITGWLTVWQAGWTWLVDWLAEHIYS